jgi:hypothetical protein
MIARGWWIAVAALAAAGCGVAAYDAKQGATSAPLTGDEAHAEIGRLEERIARLDRKLGVPSLPLPNAGGEPPPAAPGSPATATTPTVDEESGPREAKKSPVAAAPRAPEPAEKPAPPPTSSPAPSEPTRVKSDAVTVELASSNGSHRRSSRCKSVDRAAGEICEASDRICRLAGELAGEAEAARSCTRAQSECTRARDLAGGCQ